MANFFLMNRDFHSSREAWCFKIIFRETRNKCLIRREPWFSLCLSYLRQPLLRNKWFCVTVTGRLIHVATTWLVWFSVTFGQNVKLCVTIFLAIIFILSFVYLDHNGGSTSTRCPRWPRWSTRTTSLHGFTKCDCVNKFFFFNFNDVLPSSTLTLPVNIFTWKKEKQCSPGNLHAVSHFKHPTCM